MKPHWLSVMALVGCSSAPPRPATDEDARDIVVNARKLEAQGRLEAARDHYLVCLEFCPISFRPLSADRLSEISKSLPDTADRVSEVAARLEDRVANAEAVTTALVIDLAAVIAISTHWPQSFGALDLLDRLRRQASPPVYAVALDYFATFRPEAFVKIDDRDVALLLERVRSDRLRDETAMRGHARVRAEDVDEYEQARVERAVAYCAALLNAHRAQPAEEVLSSALSQARAPACEKLGAAAQEIENSAVVSLLCRHCLSLPECGSAEPVQSSPSGDTTGEADDPDRGVVRKNRSASAR